MVYSKRDSTFLLISEPFYLSGVFEATCVEIEASERADDILVLRGCDCAKLEMDESELRRRRERLKGRLVSHLVQTKGAVEDAKVSDVGVRLFRVVPEEDEREG